MTVRLWSALLSHLQDSILRSYRYASPKMRTLAMFGVVGEPLFYYFWTTSNPEGYESFSLRLIGALLCVPLLFATTGEKRGQELNVALYYCVTATYCFPFFFLYLLLMNIDAVATSTFAAVQWPMQYAMALILLVLLFPMGIIAGLMFTVGSICAWLLFVVERPAQPLSEEVIRVAWELMPIYVFILLAGTVFNRNRDIIDQEKLTAMASVGTTIAHELRTPFLGLRALAEGIQKYLPTLLRSYDLAVANRLPVEPIRLSHIDGLRRSLERISSEIDYSNAVVDMLLINSSERPVKDSEFTRFSARDCVDEAMRRYPFSSEDERNLVTLDVEDDFEVHAPRVLIVHVLFNLLKNALYYVRKAGRGRILIALNPGATSNQLVMEDTGTGIPPENIKRIFDRFFTTTETGHGAGIGLSFCQLVLNGVGGSIHCESEHGAYTRFTLDFPRVRHE